MHLSTIVSALTVIGASFGTTLVSAKRCINISGNVAYHPNHPGKPSEAGEYAYANFRVNENWLDKRCDFTRNPLLYVKYKNTAVFEAPCGGRGAKIELAIDGGSSVYTPPGGGQKVSMKHLWVSSTWDKDGVKWTFFGHDEGCK